MKIVVNICTLRAEPFELVKFVKISIIGLYFSVTVGYEKPEITTHNKTLIPFNLLLRNPDKKILRSHIFREYIQRLTKSLYSIVRHMETVVT